VDGEELHTGRKGKPRKVSVHRYDLVENQAQYSISPWDSEPDFASFPPPQARSKKKKKTNSGNEQATDTVSTEKPATM
jgi:hypothetical protein